MMRPNREDDTPEQALGSKEPEGLALLDELGCRGLDDPFREGLRLDFEFGSNPGWTRAAVASPHPNRSSKAERNVPV